MERSATSETKRRGAYYTPPGVAAALCRWALRQPSDSALDPAFGGGVFLRAAAERLRALAGTTRDLDPPVWGVELDGGAYADTLLTLGAAGTVAPSRLQRADFFAIAPGALPPVTALIGNPPYVRFQRVDPADRDRALARAAAQGAVLSSLASSWAPFVVHGCAFLRPGGRLALVLPDELGHARYARPVWRFLAGRFDELQLIAFERPLFPRLDQRTVVLLGAGHRPDGTAAARTRWLRVGGAEVLERVLGAGGALAPPPGSEGGPLDLDALAGGRLGLRAQQLPEAVRTLYTGLCGRPEVVRLGELARVETGYVSGANAYFHLSPAAAAAAELPASALRRAVFRRNATAGLVLAAADWRSAGACGAAGWLLSPDPETVARDEPALAAYLEAGLATGLGRRYKLRRRRPWYRVPRSDPPPAYLTAMNGRRSRLIVNAVAAAVPNTFHAVRPHAPATAGALAAGWQTALGALGCELEGHVLGGGMLKLEPGEARRVPLPRPDRLPPDALTRLDTLRRERGPEAAEAAADAILADALELGRDAVAALRTTAETLRRARTA